MYWTPRTKCLAVLLLACSSAATYITNLTDYEDFSEDAKLLTFEGLDAAEEGVIMLSDQYLDSGVKFAGQFCAIGMLLGEGQTSTFELESPYGITLATNQCEGAVTKDQPLLVVTFSKPMDRVGMLAKVDVTGAADTRLRIEGFLDRRPIQAAIFDTDTPEKVGKFIGFKASEPFDTLVFSAANGDNTPFLVDGFVFELTDKDVVPAATPTATPAATPAPTAVTIGSGSIPGTTGTACPYEKCDGKNDDRTPFGRKQCTAGHECIRSDDSYWQCRPKQTQEGKQPFWQQCGGIGWTGRTDCTAGSKCEPLHEWYSQCAVYPCK